MNKKDISKKIDRALMRSALQNLQVNMRVVADLLGKFGRKDKQREVLGASEMVSEWIGDL